MLIKEKYNNKKLIGFLNVDGSLRDIYVDNVTISDWTKLLKSFKSTDYKIKYSTDNGGEELPENAELIFENIDQCPRLIVKEDNITFNTGFYLNDQIEFDIDPRDFVSYECNDILYEFMKHISLTLNKPVRLTPEMEEESVLLEVKPNDENIYIRK